MYIKLSISLRSTSSLSYLHVAIVPVVVDSSVMLLMYGKATREMPTKLMS